MTHVTARKFVYGHGSVDRAWITPAQLTTYIEATGWRLTGVDTYSNAIFRYAENTSLRPPYSLPGRLRPVTGYLAVDGFWHVVQADLAIGELAAFEHRTFDEVLRDVLGTSVTVDPFAWSKPKKIILAEYMFMLHDQQLRTRSGQEAEVLPRPTVEALLEFRPALASMLGVESADEVLEADPATAELFRLCVCNGDATGYPWNCGSHVPLSQSYQELGNIGDSNWRNRHYSPFMYHCLASMLDARLNPEKYEGESVYGHLPTFLEHSFAEHCNELDAEFMRLTQATHRAQHSRRPSPRGSRRGRGGAAT